MRFLSGPCSGEAPLVLDVENRVERSGRGCVELAGVAAPTHGVRDLEGRGANCWAGFVGCVELPNRGEADRPDQLRGVVSDRRAHAADAEHRLLLVSRV